MAEWPRQRYSWSQRDRLEGLLIPLNQPQKTGLSGLEPVTLIVASSSIPWPHSYQKNSLWWPIWGQSARYSMGLRFIVEPSGFVA